MLLEKFKESKKVMDDKINAAVEEVYKISDVVSKEFISNIHNLAKDVSEEDLREFLSVNDESITIEDKLVVIAAYAEAHDDDVNRLKNKLLIILS